MYFTLGYYGLPHKLFKFLHRCEIANHRNALGLSLDFNDEELSYIESFTIFYRFILLQSYRDYWIKVANLEHGNEIISGGNIFVFLFNIEYKIKEKRDVEIAKENSIP
jgi:hypothetical protein